MKKSNSKIKLHSEIKDARITRDQAILLVKRYKEKRYGQHLTPNLSKYASFEIDLLIDYLLEMKHKYSAHDVRIYFGAREVVIQNPVIELVDVITPVIVTTTRGFVGTSGPYEEIFPDTKGAEMMALTAVSGYDFASLCPPDDMHIKSPKKSIAFDVYNAKKNSKKPSAKKKKK